MVSIVVPVYKSEQTLTKCVESLCNQTYQDIEIILVVDGPPDGSGILAEKLSKQYDKVKVVFQENQGVSVSRNRGIQEAKGEYIRFVDSDDYVLPNSVECMVDALEKSGADLCIAGFHHLYFGRTITKLPEPSGTFTTKKAKDEMLKLYQTGYMNMPWNKLYKKDLITKGFPTDLNLGEDLCFNLNYLEKTTSVTVIGETVCEYIQDDRGTTLSTKRRMDKIPIAFRLYETVRDIFERMYPEIEAHRGGLESKLVVEFLDDLEGLYFDKALSRAQKLEMIHTYEEALDKLFEKAGNVPITLPLLDYKMIYFTYKRNLSRLTLLLVDLRGMLVKLLKRR